MATPAPPPFHDDTNTARVTPQPKPILASEVLREDVAPYRPWNSELRWWFIGLGLVFAGGGAGLHLINFQADYAVSVALSAGVGLVAVGLLPFPYAVRGALAFLTGVTLLSLGLYSIGPAARWLHPDLPFWVNISRACILTVLPGVLLFRARYRAYSGARVLLAAALILALPVAIYAGHNIAESPLTATGVTSALVLAAFAASFAGFMGTGTTAGSTGLAAVVIVTTGLTTAARNLPPQQPSISLPELALSALLSSATGTLSAIGLFQLLAFAFARDARRVDVLRTRPSSMSSGESHSNQ